MKRLFSLLLIITIICITLPFAFLSIPVYAEEVAYSEGFEANNGGFAPAGQWQWGTPVSSPGSAHSGSKCWGTNLTGNVPKGSDSYLTSPAVPLRALNSNEIARVRFYGWIQIDEMYDRGEFQVSSNGNSWETKAEFFYIMQGDWTEYYFDISNYAGGNVYFRFRLYADYNDAFWIEKGYAPPYPNVNMAGWYIDDLAIEITEKPATATMLTLEAWEDQGAYASCPWVYTWDGAEFVKDNDIYSTARGAAKEYTDYYKLNKPLIARDSQYLLELKETNDESSYTDLAQLIAVDHAADVEIAADDNGQILTYSDPRQPVVAVDGEGSDILGLISTQDDTGFQGYNDDYIVLDFSGMDVSNGATLVLKAQGFQNDVTGPGEPTSIWPCIHVQTQDAGGDWVTRNEFYPRIEWSTGAYDLSEYLEASQMVRLYVASCHEGKYHVIDYAGLDTSAPAPVIINNLSAVSAVHSAFGNILDSLNASDDNYAFMAPLEAMTLAFDAPALVEGQERDFVFVSEGYYVPSGTFFIYTWDGTGWQQRDGWSQEGYTDQTKNFDLSSWLPDPDGQYKVRIWQDYWYNGARIDYVRLTQGSTAGTLFRAQDLRNTANRGATGPVPWADSVVKTAVSASDNNYLLYPTEWSDDYYNGTRGYPQRDRWLEVEWTGLVVNNPPTCNPVTITDEASFTPTINWTYNDIDDDPQEQYEIEVWTGPDGTGTIEWDQDIITGSETSIVYAGNALVGGQTYYARVKSYDGTSWGPWSETSWVPPTNQPPVAEAGGPYEGLGGSPVNFDGSGSSDPDGDELTYLWDFGDTGSDSGVAPTHVYLEKGTYTVTLTVNDPDGLSSYDTATVNILNAPPVAEAGGPYEGLEGSPVNFDGSGSSDPDGDELTYLWDFGDTGSDSGVAPAHVYVENGTYTVILTVNDPDGLSSYDTTTVNILNAPPVAEAGEDITVAEGADFSFFGSLDDPGVLDTQTVAWDFGDGVSVVDNLAPEYKYGDNGIYTATLTVTDDEGDVGTDTVTVTVTNVEPLTEAGPDQSAVSGEIVLFDGNFEDPGWLDTWDILWDFGDGNTAAGTLTPTNVYYVPGVYNVTLTVTDDDGGVGSDTLTVTVTRTEVKIDIKPGSWPNSINLNGNGVVAVAVLGSEEFDVATIDPVTVACGITGSEAIPVHNDYCMHLEDVNGDGYLDAVFHFREFELGINVSTPGNTELPVYLTAQLTFGVYVEGKDIVRITPNNDNSKGKGGKGPK